MTDKRFQDTGESWWSLGELTADDPVQVVCPKCSSRAVIIPCAVDTVRASCCECGFVSEQTAEVRINPAYSDPPTDMYFGFELWLNARFEAHNVWAYNRKHLQFLAAYVAAEQRQRTNDAVLGWRNNSLQSRLPKWMKDGKNREGLLRVIDALERKSL